jgi:DNA-binding transcriptional regulator YbjK
VSLDSNTARRARATKQERSSQRRQRIVEAAIEVIAEHGIEGVTHRLVARRAGVSLAATTYYYETKADIIADASAQLLASYVDSFRRFAGRKADAPPVSFREFATRLVMNAVGRHRSGTLAWCEIILDAARHPETRSLARTWFSALSEIWLDIARSLRVGQPGHVIPSAFDIVVGLLFVVVPLGLSEGQVEAVLSKGCDPREAWRPAADGPEAPDHGKPGMSQKAIETRERILAAAIALLIEEGPAAVNYREVAARAGLTSAAPTYYFQSIEMLLNAAEARLFESSKLRYRDVMGDVDFASLDIERLADLTAIIFLREATQFSGVSLATYPVWLEAARNPRLRPMVWSMVEDQNRAWHRLLDQVLGSQRLIDPLLLHSLYIGKLVRVLATGASISDLTRIRIEFTRELDLIAGHRHWL